MQDDVSHLQMRLFGVARKVAVIVTSLSAGEQQKTGSRPIPIIEFRGSLGDHRRAARGSLIVAGVLLGRGLHGRSARTGLLTGIVGVGVGAYLSAVSGDEDSLP